MNNWQIDLFTGLDRAINMQDVLDVTKKQIQPLGFDFCGWRSKLPLPMSNRHYTLLHSNEDKVSYREANGRYDNAPIPKHCSRSVEPISWCGTTEDPTFAMAPELWEEYYSEGHYGGWAQSLIENNMMFSMLYVDSSNPLQQKDLDNIDSKMQWIANATLIRMNQMRQKPDITLSIREQEVLRWTGDGKTADQIAEILMLSPSTINFHLRNAMMKLDAPNKTAAVVRAIFLGLLH